MPVEFHDNAEHNVLTVIVTGKLEKKDYYMFTPRVEGLLKRRSKPSVLLILRDFHGWTAGALWEDIKFDAAHFRDFEKIAVVGDKKWQKGMATFCKPFTTADVRFFPTEETPQARQWVGLEAQSQPEPEVRGTAHA